ncbi:HupE/UreJ family protein [Algiphilus sp. NNCM1]|uniref:HupE/UreJ family protein n=1 Tax=Algiphilus sp. TaxID=1872431 RepID=UPI001CA6E4C3|nr:HupE/UreJ family protein [Algiphilus sp.]MBY8964239.1 HupE/UreJ family protein [Algiphilus acroporae]MCI5102632.1 HupE/UreJ family protein [Algiphilus sp.]
MKPFTWLGLALLLCISAAPLWAHKPSDSYLQLTVEKSQVEGRWDVALRDLHELVGLDPDGNGEVTWQEVRDSRSAIIAATLPRLTLRSAGAVCDVATGALRIAEHSDGLYAALAFDGQCAAPVEQLSVHYDLLFDIDPSHRGLLRLELGGRTYSTILQPTARQFDVSLEQPALGPLFWTYLRQGAWHIWAGFDHLLFLLCLLLPAVLQRRQEGWVAATDARRATMELVAIITAFTVAHALSLSAAALDWLQLPTRWVETAVAATIIFAALNNLLPLVQRRLWMVAFFFGLIHGAGYAGVLAGLGFDAPTLALALLAFNLGVEGGQILIAAACLPFAWMARHQPLYRHLVVVPGSALAILLGSWWLAQRLFHIRLETLL